MGHRRYLFGCDWWARTRRYAEGGERIKHSQPFTSHSNFARGQTYVADVRADDRGARSICCNARSMFHFTLILHHHYLRVRLPTSSRWSIYWRRRWRDLILFSLVFKQGW